MAKVSTLRRFVELDEDCEAALLFFQLTVAAALDDLDWDEVEDALQDRSSLLRVLEKDLDVDAYVASLRTGTSHWRHVLLDVVDGDADGSQCDSSHGLAILLELATASIFVDAPRLEEATAIRRLDTVLDALGFDGWVGDLREAYLDAAQVLVGERSADWRPAALNGARRASELLSLFHPIVGVAATTALEWVNVTTAEATGTTASPVLARLLVVCALADEEIRPTLAARAGRTLMHEMAKLGRRLQAQRSAPAGGDDQRVAEILGLQRAQANALQFLHSLAGTEAEAPAWDGPELPGLAGQRLPHARALAQALMGPAGHISVRDATGTNRTIWSEGNWVVVGHEVDETAITLLVKKANE